MTRLLKSMFLAALLLLAYGQAHPSKAQTEAETEAVELLLGVNEVQIVFLAPEYDPIHVRVKVPANESFWLHLYSSPGLNVAPTVQDAAGGLIPATLSGEPPAQQLQFIPPQEGDYLLILAPSEGSAPGYTRLYYTLNEPVPAPIIEGELSFLGSPVVNTFHETFDNNDRAWWVGATKEAESKIENGAMTMTLSSNGQLLGGFTSVEGSEESFYYLTASVDIQNAGLATNFGLLFRVFDTANYYLFQIWPEQGSWRFLALLDSQWINGFGWHQDERLLNATGRHEIGVVVMNDLYMFMWDGQPLGHLTDPTYIEGGIGLFAEVAPDIVSNPTYIWDDVKLGVQDLTQPWGASFLPDAATLTPTSSIIFETTVTAP